jgi:hypothetical protein
VNDDSIAGRTQKLRQDLELLLREEWRYRRNRTHSEEDNTEHDRRKTRLVAIREELRVLVEKANSQLSHGSVWYSCSRQMRYWCGRPAVVGRFGVLQGVWVLHEVLLGGSGGRCEHTAKLQPQTPQASTPCVRLLALLFIGLSVIGLAYLFSPRIR